MPTLPISSAMSCIVGIIVWTMTMLYVIITTPLFIVKNALSGLCRITTDPTCFCVFLGLYILIKFTDTPVVVLLPKTSPMTGKKSALLFESRHEHQYKILQDIKHELEKRYSFTRFMLHVICMANAAWAHAILARLDHYRTWRYLKLKDSINHSDVTPKDSEAALTIVDCDHRLELIRAIKENRHVRDSILKTLSTSVSGKVVTTERYQTVVRLDASINILVAEWWSLHDIYVAYVKCKAGFERSPVENDWCRCFLDALVDWFHYVAYSVFDVPLPKLAESCASTNTSSNYSVIRSTPWSSAIAASVVFPKGFPYDDYDDTMFDLILELVLYHQHCVCIVRSKDYLVPKDHTVTHSANEVAQILNTLRASIPPQIPFVAIGFSLGGSALYRHLKAHKNHQWFDSTSGPDVLDATDAPDHDNSPSNPVTVPSSTLFLVGGGHDNYDVGHFMKSIGSDYYYHCNECLIDMWSNEATNRKDIDHDTSIIYLSHMPVPKGLSPISGAALISPLIDIPLSLGGTDLAYRDGGYWYNQLIGQRTAKLNEWEDRKRILVQRNLELEETQDEEMPLPAVDGPVLHPSKWNDLTFQLMRAVSIDGSSARPSENPLSGGSSPNDVTGAIGDTTSVHYYCRKCARKVAAPGSTALLHNDPFSNYVDMISVTLPPLSPNKITHASPCPIVVLVAEDDVIARPSQFPITKMHRGENTTILVSPFGNHAEFHRDTYSTRTWASETIGIFFNGMLE